MRIVQITTDKRKHFKNYGLAEPYISRVPKVFYPNPSISYFSRKILIVINTTFYCEYHSFLKLAQNIVVHDYFSILRKNLNFPVEPSKHR
jgi:hypothetical protein